MLASGIAHDLNNVLSPIILAAPLLEASTSWVAPGHGVRLIDSLETSAARGDVELVRQILSFCARGVGRGSMKQVPPPR